MGLIILPSKLLWVGVDSKKTNLHFNFIPRERKVKQFYISVSLGIMG
jgi:hypothetical protein